MATFIVIFLSSLGIIWAEDPIMALQSLNEKPWSLKSEIMEYIEDLLKSPNAVTVQVLETDSSEEDVSKIIASARQRSEGSIDDEFSSLIENLEARTTNSSLPKEPISLSPEIKLQKEPVSINPVIKKELLDLFKRSGSESVPESPVDGSLDDFEDLAVRLGSLDPVKAVNKCEDMHRSCPSFKELCNEERVSTTLLKECPQTCGVCNKDCEPSKCQFKDEQGLTKKGICSDTSQPKYYEIGVGGCKDGCKCLIPIGQKGYRLPSECDSIHINGEFSLFKNDHKQALLSLIRHFESVGVEQLEKLPQYIKDIQPYLNVRLFVAAYSNALKNLGIKDLPPICETFPEDFVLGSLLDELKKQSNITKVDMKKRQVEQQNTVRVTRLGNGDFSVIQKLDLSGTNQILEHRLAYFREDHGMNSHHYNWHREMNNVDPPFPRSGELFIYMHAQMLKRYNIERMAVGLPRAVEYSDFYTPIEVGHRSNLGYASRPFGVRDDNMIPWDFVTRDRIREQSDLKAPLENQLLRQIDNDTKFLEDLEQYHNVGHDNIANAVRNTPRGRRPNVMLYSETSARDNVFFRWHQHIDDIYEDYAEMKRKGSSLTLKEMTFNDVKLEWVNVFGTRSRDLNQLWTGCGYHQMDITNGLAFFETSPFNVRIKMIHLDHEPFTYIIRYHNQARSVRSGVVRIFLAPKNDITGNTMDIEEQRKYWIEMDKFRYDFPPGRNSIRRLSSESSVTVDCRSTVKPVNNCEDKHSRCQFFRNWCRDRAFRSECPKTCGLCNRGDVAPEENRQCGCGWPQHLLLPRGTADGMDFNLFVIVTDEDNIEDWTMAGNTYCGVSEAEIYDTRYMGFPFHAPGPREIRSIRDFPNILSNSAVSQISIHFSGEQTNPDEVPVDGCGRD